MYITLLFQYLKGPILGVERLPLKMSVHVTACEDCKKYALQLKSKVKELSIWANSGINSLQKLYTLKGGA